MDAIRPGQRYHAPIVPAFPGGLGDGRYVKAAGPKQSPEAVLTYPIRDLQGDVVEPGGIDWTEFNSTYERLVNLEHGPYIGTAEVEYKSLPVLDHNRQPDESLGLIRLPVGVTTFFDSSADAAKHTLRKFDANGRVVGTYTADECARYAEQTYPLVTDGTLSGVSLEFKPSGPENVAFKSLGKSPLLNRPAYHFYRTEALGYAAACHLPVNQVAGYVAASDETLAKAEKALRLCERPTTLDLIRKSLSPLVRVLKSQTPSGRVTAPVRREPVSTKTAPKRVNKADEYMDDPMPMDEPPVEDAPMEDAPADDMKPTPAALFQFAQALRDACAMADDMATRGEHVQGVKALKKFCEQVDSIADKAAAMAGKVAAAVDTGEAAEMDMEADAEPVETDDDGMIQAKAFAATWWRPRRFVKGTPYTLKHLKGEKKGKPDGGDDAVKLLEWAMNRIDELEAKRA
jgi:hypothetical protein